MDDLGLQTPPSLPPTPPTPVAPAPTPAPMPEPVVPENPATVTPPKKKFPVKFVAGALMALLLVGGTVFLSRQLVQQKQTAEQFAGDYDYGDETCTQGDIQNETTCVSFCQECRQAGGECFDHAGKQIGEVVWSCTEPLVKQGCYERCLIDITCKSWLKCQDVNGTKRCVNPACPESDQSNWCGCASPSPSPSAPPSASPSPSPSASPPVILSCVDLTKNTATPKVGDTVTFTCAANFSATAPVAFFRHSTDDGITFTPNPSPVPIAKETANPQAGNTGSGFKLTIDKPGDWEVQCQVCTDTTATTCTAWGLAQ